VRRRARRLTIDCRRKRTRCASTVLAPSGSAEALGRSRRGSRQKTGHTPSPFAAAHEASRAGLSSTRCTIHERVNVNMCACILCADVYVCVCVVRYVCVCTRVCACVRRKHVSRIMKRIPPQYQLGIFANIPGRFETNAPQAAFCFTYWRCYSVRGTNFNRQSQPAARFARSVRTKTTGV